MNIFGFFGKAVKALGSPSAHTAATIAGAALGVYNPGLGNLFELVANAVYTVEQKYAAAAGSEKKEQVKAIIDISAPVTVSVLEQVSGATIKDASAFGPALDKLIDDVVELFNLLGVFGHKAAPGAIAPIPAATPHVG